MRVTGEVRGFAMEVQVRLLLLRVRLRLCPEGVYLHLPAGERRVRLHRKRRLPRAVTWLLQRLRVKRASIQGEIGCSRDAARAALAGGTLQGLLCMGAAALGVKRAEICIGLAEKETLWSGSFCLDIGF